MLQWFTNRMQLAGLMAFLAKKTVPQHRHSFWYFWGGLALFFFLIQLITGMLLTLYYSPTPSSAHESVEFIIKEVPFGWLVRSLHSWSANLMIFSVFVHLFSTFFMKAYRKPRELMWVSGVLLLFLVLGFGFTGYLLPWDNTSYFATQIGTEIPRSIPILGDFAAMLLRGGEYVAEESMKRLFALHVVILPILTLILVVFHLVLNQVQGTSTPIGARLKGPGIPFYPNYMYRDLIAWTIGLIILSAFALLSPVNLGIKADPFASAPLGIKPEWYFLTLYQTMRFAPSTIFGMNGEMVVNIVVLLTGATLIGVPFLDRRAATGKVSPAFTVLGISALAYMLIAITAAYLY